MVTRAVLSMINFENGEGAIVLSIRVLAIVLFGIVLTEIVLLGIVLLRIVLTVPQENSGLCVAID